MALRPKKRERAGKRCMFKKGRQYIYDQKKSRTQKSAEVTSTFTAYLTLYANLSTPR